MEKIVAKFSFFFFIVFFCSISIYSQDLTNDFTQTDLIFYNTIEDDESDDFFMFKSQFIRKYNKVEEFSRYNNTKNKFVLLPIGLRTDKGKVSVPKEIFDFFENNDMKSKKDKEKELYIREKINSKKCDLSLEQDYFFNNKIRYFKNKFKIKDKKLKNDLNLEINTDGWLLTDSFNFKFDSKFGLFNHFWSYSDEKKRLFQDAIGFSYKTEQNVEFKFVGYGGYDIYANTALGGSSFFALFSHFTTGGYISYRDNGLNFGSIFKANLNFIEINSFVDFITDFNKNFILQPDMMIKFSFFPVSFSFFKLSETFYTEKFKSITNKIQNFRYDTKKLKSVAGCDMFIDLNRVYFDLLTTFYSINSDFLSLDQNLTFVSPEFFGEFIVTSVFKKFSLYFSDYIDFDFSPNINFGSVVGVKNISVKYVLMGFFADFAVLDNCNDYRLTILTEIYSDFAKNLTFYLKTFNELYLNKLSIDFYIQVGFKSLL